MYLRCFARYLVDSPRVSDPFTSIYTLRYISAKHWLRRRRNTIFDVHDSLSSVVSSSLLASMPQHRSCVLTCTTVEFSGKCQGHDAGVRNKPVYGGRRMNVVTIAPCSLVYEGHHPRIMLLDPPAYEAVLRFCRDKARFTQPAPIGPLRNQHPIIHLLESVLTRFPASYSLMTFTAVHCCLADWRSVLRDTGKVPAGISPCPRRQATREKEYWATFLT